MNVSDFVRRSILERARMPIVDPQDMQAEIDAARAALADADAAGMALVRDNERLLAEIERIKVQTDWAEIDKLRAENERLKEAVTDLGLLHTQDYVEIERLRVALNELANLDYMREVERLKAQLVEADRKVREYRPNVDAALAENEQLKGDAGQLAIDLSVALDQNERLRAALEKIVGMGHVSIDWAHEVAREALGNDKRAYDDQNR